MLWRQQHYLSTLFRSLFFVCLFICKASRRFNTHKKVIFYKLEPHDEFFIDEAVIKMATFTFYYLFIYTKTHFEIVARRHGVKRIIPDELIEKCLGSKMGKKTVLLSYCSVNKALCCG